MNRVLKKLRRDKKEFVTFEELKEYCKELYFNYKIISNYLVSRGYLVKILEDIYYLKTDDEIKQKKLRYSILELVGKGLKLRNINNWYYGLYTALNLNNIDYEHRDIFYYVINDRISNIKPKRIMGKEFRFLTLKNVFFNFGIKKGVIKYSDPEKTILDLIYMWNYSKINENKILFKISKLLKGISEEKILKYSQYYPESNKIILEKGLS
ncbi:hypothetical protein LCGC14_2090450 [marine sediment metagenome]|uniref:AbiEi antitoxin C-terminal domain-containing protein n=1 Tax=marine sediment metagenome TaxID=412755 RepID=A0A0F9GR17_9ZZZZ